MTTTTLRKRVHNYVDKVDESFLKVVNAMLEEHFKNLPDDSLLSQDQKNELEKRINMRRNGKGSGANWQVVKARILKKSRKSII